MDASLSSHAEVKRIFVNPYDDHISQLPEELLVSIVKHLSTKDCVKTSVLSKEWRNVWKLVPYLSFRMCDKQSVDAEESITEVINNHYGHLVCGQIHHCGSLSKPDVFETWIRKLIQEKHTKFLILSNHITVPKKDILLQLPPNTFSHSNLALLFLSLYELKTAHAFNNCHNLKVLKLEKIYAEVDVLNRVIASCPSLKVLVLQVIWYNERTCFKIHNDNLKLLHVHSPNVDCFEVFAPILEIFSISGHLHMETKFVVNAPRLLFNSWVKDVKKVPYMIYNISCYAQNSYVSIFVRESKDKKNRMHPFLVGIDAIYLKWLHSLKVVLDATNSKEVEMLRKVLIRWDGKMKELHILFKDNNVSKDDGESSIGEQQKNKWEETNLFTNADFRVEVLWMYNFSGLKKQFQLASCFVTQGTIMKKMMIQTSSIILANEMLDLEVVISRLKELPTGNEKLCIEYF